MDNDRVTVEYKLPAPPTNEKMKMEVLPTDKPGGAGVTLSRTSFFRLE